jgi:hypothetical protein
MYGTPQIEWDNDWGNAQEIYNDYLSKSSNNPAKGYEL